MTASTVTLQEETKVRRYALALLRRSHPILYQMPSILCVVFGAVGAFVGSSLCSLTGSQDVVLTMVFCLGGIGVLGTGGGLLGRRIVDFCSKRYMPTAAAVVTAEAAPGKRAGSEF